jgi:hypothetical protein
VLVGCASYIPLFWLSFFSPADIRNAERYGQFILDRKRAVERSSERLRFFASLFPQIKSFRAIAGSLIKKVASQKSKTIGIELVELLAYSDPALPGLKTAIEMIENQDAGYSSTVPGRTVKNPFTGKKLVIKERRFRTTQELLLHVCRIEADALTSRSKDPTPTVTKEFVKAFADRFGLKTKEILTYLKRKEIAQKRSDATRETLREKIIGHVWE